VAHPAGTGFPYRDGQQRKGRPLLPAKKSSGALRLPGMQARESEFDDVGVLFARNPLPMWIFDPRTLRFIEVNEAAVRQYGYSRDEFLSMSTAEIRAPQDVPALIDMNSPPAASGALRKHRCKDGSIRTVELDSQTLEYEGREVVLVVIRDVTERTAVEEALRQSEARYRDLFEDATDIIYVHDLNGKMLSVNRAAERLTGFSRDDLVGISLSDFVAPEYIARVRDAMERKVDGGEARTTYEIEILTKSGARLALEVSTRLIYAQGKAIAVEGVARDVSDRKRAQEVIQRQSERAEALALVSRSIADARLDLPSILDSVAGMASALVGDACVIRLLGDSGDELETVAIHHQNEHAVALVRRISDTATYSAHEGLYARLLESGGPVRIEKVDHSTDIPPSMQPHYAAYIREFGIESILAVPLMVQGALIGSITMTRDRDGAAYTAEDERFLVELADRAAIAIANARLFEMTRARLKQVQALRRIDTSIIGALDVGTTLDVIVEQIRAELELDAAAVLLLDPGSRMLTFASGSGFGTNVRGMALSLAEGSLASVVIERKMVVTHDIATNEDFSRRPLAAREGFVTHIAVPLVARTEVKGVLELFQRRHFDPTPGWQEFFAALATQAAIAIDNAQLFEEMQRANIEQALAYETTLEGWSRALDLRDQETEGHSARVAQMTARLARALGINGDDLVNLRRGALLHDIGKMAIPDAILRKPGPLTDDEWEIMRRHPVYAYDLLAPTRFLRPVLDVPYAHHERWDGSGYPRGLSNEDIPLAARIFAIVDVYDALRTQRTYRAAFPEHEARAYLSDHAGKLFDPEMTKLFLSLDS
jgi:PAS domain S-box-containing protein/putative nucleotidyltransferase with HDIG domain